MKKALLIGTLILAGCAAPNPNAVYPQKYEQTMRDSLNRYLKDPGSLSTFQVTKPPFIHRFTGKYAACAVINAKNSLGGYTGNTATLFSFSVDGQHIVEVTTDAEYIGCG